MKRFIFVLCACLLCCTMLTGYTEINNQNLYEKIYIPDSWIEAGARVIKGEASGIKSEDQRAATLVVALNRTLDDRWPDDLCDVIFQAHQFAPYKGFVEQEYYELAERTITNWYETEEDSYYILPKDYFFFAATNGINYFRKEYRSTDHWRFDHEQDS